MFLNLDTIPGIRTDSDNFFIINTDQLGCIYMHPWDQKLDHNLEGSIIDFSLTTNIERRYFPKKQDALDFLRWFQEKCNGENE